MADRVENDTKINLERSETDSKVSEKANEARVSQGTMKSTQQENENLSDDSSFNEDDYFKNDEN